MPDRAALLDALHPVLNIIADIDPASPDAAQTLNERLPMGGPVLEKVGSLVRAGAHAGWLAPKGEAGMRFGRVSRPSLETRDFAVDAVDMDHPGPPHTHPRGELNLCFAIEGSPSFDGQPPGWVVLPPGSWHVPTVVGGRMAILYFLPGGAYQSGPDLAPQAADG